MVVAAILGGCAPDYLGIYKIDRHDWIAAIMTAPDKLDCTNPGRAVDDGAAYFSLVSDGAHAGAAQFVRCDDPADCVVQEGYAWFELSDTGGIHADATVITSELDPPTCSLSLTTFEVVADSDRLKIDMYAHDNFPDDVASCSEDRARRLASESTCSWVDRYDGQRVQ